MRYFFYYVRKFFYNLINFDRIFKVKFILVYVELFKKKSTVEY